MLLVLTLSFNYKVLPEQSYCVYDLSGNILLFTFVITNTFSNNEIIVSTKITSRERSNKHKMMFRLDH